MKKTNALSMHGIMSKCHNIFSTSLFQTQEKLEVCRSSKLNFSSSCFIADDSCVKMYVWLHVEVFREHDILHF